jgi:hypothetical protein
MLYNPVSSTSVGLLVTILFMLLFLVTKFIFVVFAAMEAISCSSCLPGCILDHTVCSLSAYIPLLTPSTNLSWHLAYTSLCKYVSVIKVSK